MATNSPRVTLGDAEGQRPAGTDLRPAELPNGPLLMASTFWQPRQDVVPVDARRRGLLVKPALPEFYQPAWLPCRVLVGPVG